MKKLSVVLATFNEEKNLERCLASVASFADEIVVVDGDSTDRTVAVAKKFGATVIVTDNPPVFHINKQKAVDAATGEWILQLDADEVVTRELSREIGEVISLKDSEREVRVIDAQKLRLFLRHQRIVEKRDGKVGSGDGDIVAYFVPRLNYFLGGTIRFAGTYPDGVIRLFKRQRAYFPSKTVHEQLVVDGRVSWLSYDLLHFSNPTLTKYIQGAKKYIHLLADELEQKKVPKNVSSLLFYLLMKPAGVFFDLFVRHKGVLDGVRGFLFCLFSALHYPLGYLTYVTRN